MTSRESEILNIIYRLGGRCSIRLISKETGLSSDYASLISRELLNQKLVKRTANKVFILTTSGRSLLERSRDGSEEEKTPTLIEVSRSFGSEVEPPPFEPEIHFISKESISEQPYLTEHNLGKGQITEVADARLIQKSIKRLTFVNHPVRGKTPTASAAPLARVSNGVNRKRPARFALPARIASQCKAGRRSKAGGSKH